jgi:hypothetical protein
MKKNRELYTIFILISILFIILILNTPKLENFQNNTGYDIILIAGQSNSVGRGLEEHNFPKTRTGLNHKTWAQTLNMYRDDYHGTHGRPNSLICALNKDNSIRESAIDPIHHQENFPYRLNNRSIRNNFGFAVSFAREYIRQNKLSSGRKILLVGCGWGGTGFRDNGRWMFPNGDLYKGTIERANNAFRKTDNGNNNRFIAILWHQGENDVSSPTGYRENVSACLNGIRTAIKKNNPHTIPILMGGLTNDTENRRNFTEQHIKTVKDMSGNRNFRFVPSNAIPNVFYKDLALFNHDLLPDKDTGNNHFSKSSQIEFGKRYFYVFNDNKFDIQT